MARIADEQDAGLLPEVDVPDLVERRNERVLARLRRCVFVFFDVRRTARGQRGERQDRLGGADDLPIDVRASMRRGHSFKDAVAPEGAGIEADRLRVGGRWARALYLTDYASYIKDGFLAELTDARRAMALSIDVVPVPTDEAVREVERRLLGVETNITNWTRRQNANMNYNVAVPYDMEQQRKESREFLDDLMSRDQRRLGRGRPIRRRGARIKARWASPVRLRPAASRVALSALDPPRKSSTSRATSRIAFISAGASAAFQVRGMINAVP